MTLGRNYSTKNFFYSKTTQDIADKFLVFFM